MRKLILTTIAMFVLLSTGVMPERLANAETSIPQKYSEIYAKLEKKLAENDKLVKQSEIVWGPIGAELVSANSNRGVELLKPETFTFIKKNIAELKSLGTNGLTVNIAFPLLRPSTPRQKEYLAFYKKLAAEIKVQGMALMVKVHNIFPDEVFGNPTMKIKGIKYGDYVKQKKDQIWLIAKELKPDFLTLDNEPATQKYITGFNFTPELWKTTLASFLDGFKHDGIKVGAGAGSWDDVRYFKLMCELPLDFIDIHIYPVNGDCLVKNVTTIANIAASKGKDVVIGEAWLYKSLSFSSSPEKQDYVANFVSDAYSFWEPLDIRFVKIVAMLSRNVKAKYTSFFQSNYCFSYIPYDEAYETMNPKDILAKLNKSVSTSMLSNPPKLTKTGLAFKDIFKSSTNVAVKIIMPSNGGRISYCKVNGLVAYDQIGSDGFYDLWTMKPDGTERKCLTAQNKSMPKNNGNPCWDPSGKYIVFQSQDPNYRLKNERFGTPGIGINNNIFITDTKGTNFWRMSKVRNGGGSLHPHFSSSGKRIIWGNAIPSENPVGSWEMMEFEINLSPQPKLVEMNTLYPDRMQLYETHGYSPDGKRIIFSGIPKDKGYFEMEIFTSSLDGGDLKKLTGNQDWDEHAHFSPDGKKIVWASSSGINCPKEPSKLQMDYWVMNADGSGKKRITFFNEPRSAQYLGSVVASDFDWIDSDTIIARLGLTGGSNGTEMVAVVNLKF